MIFSRWPIALGLVLLLTGASGAAQISSVVAPRHSLTWPSTPAEIATANKMPARAIASFLGIKSTVPGTAGINGFRFAYLEPRRVYLVVGEPTRAGVWLVTLSRIGAGRFRQTLLNEFVNGTISMSLVDMQGDGVDEVIGRKVVNYRGAFTDPVYWYTINAFHDGKPEDLSAQFPEFYRDVVLPRLDYLGRVFGWIQMNVPAKLLRANPGQLGNGSPDIELAEVGFVQLKYQHVILGDKNAGLDQAIKWAKFPNTDIAVLGVRSLGEMTAPKAWEEIHKLWNSPNYAVCSEARGLWLKRIGKPYTEKYECPRPGARGQVYNMGGSNYDQATVALEAASACSGSANWTLNFKYTTVNGSSYSGSATTSTTIGQSTNYTTPVALGGQVNAQVQATLAGQSFTQSVTFYVLGTPIPDPTITSQLDWLYRAGTTPNLLTGIASKEGSYMQFYSQETRMGVMGEWPYESYDGGSHVGLMQVPNTLKDAFDWYTNTSDGYGIFESKLTSAHNYVSNQIAGHPSLPAATGSQYEDDALVYYGPYGAAGTYWVPSSDYSTWVPNPNNTNGVNYANAIRNDTK